MLLLLRTFVYSYYLHASSQISKEQTPFNALYDPALWNTYQLEKCAILIGPNY